MALKENAYGMRANVTSQACLHFHIAFSILVPCCADLLDAPCAMWTPRHMIFLCHRILCRLFTHQTIAAFARRERLFGGLLRCTPRCADLLCGMALISWSPPEIPTSWCNDPVGLCLVVWGSPCLPRRTPETSSNPSHAALPGLFCLHHVHPKFHPHSAKVAYEHSCVCVVDQF